MTRGQNKFIGEFKMAEGDVISLGGDYEIHVRST